MAPAFRITVPFLLVSSSSNIIGFVFSHICRSSALPEHAVLILANSYQFSKSVFLLQAVYSS